MTYKGSTTKTIQFYAFATSLQVRLNAEPKIFVQFRTKPLNAPAIYLHIMANAIDFSSKTDEDCWGICPIPGNISKIRQTIFCSLILSLLTSFLFSGLASSFHCCAAKRTGTGNRLVDTCCNNNAPSTPTLGSEDGLTIDSVQLTDCLLCKLISQLNQAENCAPTATFATDNNSTAFFANTLTVLGRPLRNRGRDPPL